MAIGSRRTQLLKAGMNTITIVRTFDDDLHVKDIVVHWRE